MTDSPHSITVFTHTRPADTEGALRRVVELAGEAGVEVRLPAAETDKFGAVQGVAEAPQPYAGTDLALVLGGDGTILTALREFAGTGVPVFALNYGAIGFLATIEPWELEDGVRRALRGEFDVMELPGLVAATAEGERVAINDVSLHRRQDGRVAELAYSVEGEQLGEVRCDGLVVATPAGSTGYNLANGGPVLAWGVEGYVVSFIAPHTLTARALVVAPGDALEVTNRSRSEEVDVSTDARQIGTLAPEATMKIQFKQRQSLLAQAHGATFYHRLRDKFGRLAY
ncbi:MAG: NAD(+)/NADH kinase [Thermoleophilaceae bacterium]|nr:NAD(+)/NADH kinase [Thermoleophilaceae bacterium]